MKINTRIYELQVVEICKPNNGNIFRVFQVTFLLFSQKSTQLVREFYKPEGSSSCSEDPTIGTYSEPDATNPHPRNLLSKHVLILFSALPHIFQVIS
jgi:hypothetical protein